MCELKERFQEWGCGVTAQLVVHANELPCNSAVSSHRGTMRSFVRGACGWEEACGWDEACVWVHLQYVFHGGCVDRRQHPASSTNSFPPPVTNSCNRDASARVVISQICPKEMMAGVKHEQHKLNTYRKIH